MIFTSDNWAGAHPAISEALTRHATGFSAAYGTGDLDRQVEATFNQIFEREVAVFFVGTGTAANSIGLASVAKPGGVARQHVILPYAPNVAELSLVKKKMFKSASARAKAPGTSPSASSSTTTR